jgi:nitroreductase
MKTLSVIEQILDLARWAPSGDNVQSHRFQIAGPRHLVIHASDTRADCVYDLDGHASQIAFGALLETIAIAATAHGWRTSVERRPRLPSEDAHLIFDVHFEEQAGLAVDPLISHITTRAVQRRPMSTRRLTVGEKALMETSVGPSYVLRWLETGGEKLQAAQLMYRNAKLRLTMPEAYEVHKRIIHWGVARSPDRVPDQALGADALTLRLMKWAMTSWKRLSAVNAIAGTWAPRMQMDFVPSLMCAAHFVIQARQEPRTIDDFVAAGRAVQRFWLSLTSLGLFMQPEMTPLIFARYVNEGRQFSKTGKLQAQAAELRQRSAVMISGPDRHPVFMGRLGEGPAPFARAERKPLEQLMLP